MIENLEVVDYNVDAENVTQVRIRRSDGTIQTFNTEIPSFVSTKITANGTYHAPENTGFDTVEVRVPITGKTQTIDVLLNQPAQVIRPTSDYDAIRQVNVPSTLVQALGVQTLEPGEITYKASDSGIYGFNQVTVPGYASILRDVTLSDLSSAGIELGRTQVITPERIFGQGSNIKGFRSFQLPSAILQSKTVQPSMTERTVTPDFGYYGLKEVTVPSVASQLADVIFHHNGTYHAPGNNIGFYEVTVDVDTAAAEVQEKTYTATTNSIVNIYPDEGYAGISKLTLTTQVTKTLFRYALKTIINGVEEDAEWEPSASYGAGLDSMKSVYTNPKVPARTGSTEYEDLYINPILKTLTGLEKKQVVVKYEEDDIDGTWRLFLYDANGFSKETSATGGTPIYLVESEGGEISI